MKTLYLIGGTMGVGKTTVCQRLKHQLNNCAFLDGDWCWDMEPFCVTEETKRMVMDNICYLLNQFLRCSVYENIVFCWVMHRQSIIDEIQSRLNLQQCRVVSISLVCAPDVLTKRLRKDIEQGHRKSDVLQRSLARLPLYERLDTIQIDVSNQTVEETAALIQSL